MKKILLILGMLAMCAIAQAGLTLTCSFTDDPVNSYVDNPTDDTHNWDFTADEDKLGGQLNVYEHYRVAYPATDAVDMHLAADDDPTIRVSKYVTNENGHDWTGYTLTLNGPAGVKFIAPAWSDVFTVYTVTDNLITYSGGTVLRGNEVQLDFRVFVPTAGNFTWCVTQQAIPEPATLILLGLGGLGLFRKK